MENISSNNTALSLALNIASMVGHGDDHHEIDGASDPVVAFRTDRAAYHTITTQAKPRDNAEEVYIQHALQELVHDEHRLAQTNPDRAFNFDPDPKLTTAQQAAADRAENLPLGRTSIPNDADQANKVLANLKKDWDVLAATGAKPEQSADTNTAAHALWKIADRAETIAGEFGSDQVQNPVPNLG